MTRNGKIARLPHSIRSQVNDRLHNGEEGKTIVEWLNGLPPVRELLEKKFDGKPVSEQNLSEWKQGGYADWLRHQEKRSMCGDFLDEAQEVEEETDGAVLTDRLTGMLALTLMRLLREAMEEEKGPKQRAAVLGIAREFDRLRRGDHRMEQVRRQSRRSDAEWRQKEEEAKKRAEQEKAAATKKDYLRPVWEIVEKHDTASLFGGGERGWLIAEYISHQKTGNPLPEDWLRRCQEVCLGSVKVDLDELDLDEPDSDELDADEDDADESGTDEPAPAESDPIKPDQAE